MFRTIVGFAKLNKSVVVLAIQRLRFDYFFERFAEMVCTVFFSVKWEF